MALEHFYLKHSNLWKKDKKHSKATKGKQQGGRARWRKQRVVNSECMRGTLLVQLLHPHDPTPSQLLPVSTVLNPSQRPMWPRTRRTTPRLPDEQSPTTWTQTKVACGTQEAKRSRISDALITLGPRGCLPLVPPAAPAGAPWGQILDRGSRCFFRCITQPLESSDFTTAHHLLLLKGTFLLRSDKSSTNVTHSPLSPRQRPRNIATHQVLLSFVWSIAEWHGKTKNRYEQTTLT